MPTCGPSIPTAPLAHKTEFRSQARELIVPPDRGHSVVRARRTRSRTAMTTGGTHGHAGGKDYTCPETTRHIRPPRIPHHSPGSVYDHGPPSGPGRRDRRIRPLQRPRSPLGPQPRDSGPRCPDCGFGAVVLSSGDECGSLPTEARHLVRRPLRTGTPLLRHRESLIRSQPVGPGVGTATPLSRCTDGVVDRGGDVVSDVGGPAAVVVEATPPSGAGPGGEAGVAAAERRMNHTLSPGSVMSSGGSCDSSAPAAVMAAAQQELPRAAVMAAAISPRAAVSSSAGPTTPPRRANAAALSGRPARTPMPRTDVAPRTASSRGARPPYVTNRSAQRRSAGCGVGPLDDLDAGVRAPQVLREAARGHDRIAADSGRTARRRLRTVPGNGRSPRSTPASTADR